VALSGSLGNIIRCMSLVPEEARTQRELLPVHYVSFEKVREPNSGVGVLTRPQMELIAAKVSTMRECFFALVPIRRGSDLQGR
jgi:hypothetical protein